MSFSQRKGLKPLSKEIQRESMDDELRYGLWSCVHLCYLERWDGSYNSLAHSNMQWLFVGLWHDFFKWPVDNLNLTNFRDAVKRVREFFMKCEWNEAYDFVEFVIKNGPEEFADDFRQLINQVLERDAAAYRFVEDEVTEITSAEEIEAIESAIADTSAITGVQAHLRQGLAHLSDRKKPDYRNSIKESISAVEGLCQRITGDSSASLGKALKAIEPQITLHPALREAILKLYGYTSDADGIRHAMMDESSLSYADAKFMLVTCSAFTNFILGKCAEMNTKIA